MLTINELMYIAKAELAYIKSEEIYLVRNLFKSYECNRISRSDRLLIGTLFLTILIQQIVKLQS